MRLVDWMSFATILPLVFGVCFQTPLVMVFLERIGIFTADDFRAKRKIAILIIVIAGAVLTPGQDPFSQCMLAVPMIILYELGILMVSRRKKAAIATWPIEADGARGTRPMSRTRERAGSSIWWGPGPGDPGLLTRRGEAVLSRADVVVYDHLASRGCSTWPRASALRICAGKSIGHCTLTQDEINALLVEHARRGGAWSGSRGATRTSSAGGPRRPSTSAPRASPSGSCPE